MPFFSSKGMLLIESRAVDGGVSQRDEIYTVFLLIKVAHPFGNRFRCAIEVSGVDA